jgi:hypothetical protein
VARPRNLSGHVAESLHKFVCPGLVKPCADEHLECAQLSKVS